MNIDLQNGSKKYGLRFDLPSPEHWVFGSSEIPYEVLQENGDWTDFLVVKERQDLNNIEPYACVIFTLLNCIEIIIKRKYGIERNYSDRFLATIVNTRGRGCTPQEACEFLRKIGVPPQDVYPFDSTIDTEDKFFAPISDPKLIKIAEQFNEEWDFKHDFVRQDNDSITSALKSSPLLISVYAWIINSKGLYYKPDGFTDNHATTLIYEKINELRRIFDSYDTPYIKDLEYKDMPMVIKRFWVKKKIDGINSVGSIKNEKKDSVINRIINWFLDLFKVKL